MAYKQNPGRGPMMKTGEGVPSALLQKDEKIKMTNFKQTPGRGNNSKTGHGIPQSMTSPLHQVDPKTGKKKHPGWKAPTFNSKVEKTGDAFTDSYVNLMEKKNQAGLVKKDSVAEADTKWPKVGDRINTNTSNNSPGDYTLVRSIDEKTGDYTVGKGGTHSSKHKKVPRMNMRRLTHDKVSLKNQGN